YDTSYVDSIYLQPFPTRRSSDLKDLELYEYESIEEFFEKSSGKYYMISKFGKKHFTDMDYSSTEVDHYFVFGRETKGLPDWLKRSEEHTSELQSRFDIVCRLLLE